MKSVTLMLLVFVTTFSVSAQGVFSNGTSAALQRVIEDYPNRFKNIKGDRLQQHNGYTDYQSRVQIPGSVNCVVTQENPPREICNWTCSLFVTSDFEKAKQRFQELYQQISNTIIRIKGEKPFILNGSYTEPNEENKELSIRFHLLPAPEPFQNLRVEIAMRFREEWEIYLWVAGE